MGDFHAHRAGDFRQNGRYQVYHALRHYSVFPKKFSLVTVRDSTTVTPPTAMAPNEHWSLPTTASPVTATKVGADLPASRRFDPALGPTKGFACSRVLVDPVHPNSIVCVGRWGELLWRDTQGTNFDYFKLPGYVANAAGTLVATQMWRGACVNTDMGTLALGDHDIFGIDEYRGKGLLENDVCSLFTPPCGVPLPCVSNHTISALAYVSTTSRYRLIGDGCPLSTGSYPNSYVNMLPRRGSPSFQFTLKTGLAPLPVPPQPAAALNIALSHQPAVLLPNGCPLYLRSVIITTPFASMNAAGDTSVALPIPATVPIGLSFGTQWLIWDPSITGPLPFAFSDGREFKL